MRGVESETERRLDVGRLEALTDGVFAIAITLLAIEIGVPHIASDRGADLRDAVLDQWPSYAAYAVTFFLIGAYWMNHHRMFRLLTGVTHRFLVLNIFFLMAIAIIPFPNAVLAEYLAEPELRGVAAAVYGLAMIALAVMFNLVWWYVARHPSLLRPDCNMADLRKVLRSYVMGPVAYGVGLAFAFVAPLVSLAIYVALPLGYMFEGPVKTIDAGYISEED
ncbi:MAG TPA: TMEM175 family protein [Acidimicrobiia bacterium]|nr:TMEM175 family protein [Acidimicrobiia bacterium]